MADLAVKYMGLSLKSPLIVGSSGLTNTAEDVKKCEAAGAGAVILKSIFEEQIHSEVHQEMKTANFDMHPEAAEYVQAMTRDRSVSKYLSLISDSKKAVQIPVIASVNCVSAEGWLDFARKLEEAGADGIELNVFIFDIDHRDDSKEIEERYLKILRAVKSQVKIPVALKISNQFTNLASIIRHLEFDGVDAVVMFNRFLHNDINLDKMKVTPGHGVSSPDEFMVPLRWIGLLSHETRCDLCGSTGVHNGEQAIKLILAGAKAVQVTSALYLHKIEYLKELTAQIDAWLDKNGHKSINDIRGKLCGKDPAIAKIFSRFQYMKYLMER
jgi:dihydroorotate dehydrogenase (fumarate)